MMQNLNPLTLSDVIKNMKDMAECGGYYEVSSEGAGEIAAWLEELARLRERSLPDLPSILTQLVEFQTQTADKHARDRIDRAIDALTVCIPKRPEHIRPVGKSLQGWCPKCGSHLSYEPEECYWCGQKLLWGREANHDTP